MGSMMWDVIGYDQQNWQVMLYDQVCQEVSVSDEVLHSSMTMMMVMMNNQGWQEVTISLGSY